MNDIVIENLSHTYPGTRQRPARQVLTQLNLAVKTGEVFGLLGPNGGGKSTLFKILSTMMLPTSGSAMILHHNVVQAPSEVRKNIGVVFQNPSLDKKLTLLENILFQGRLYGLSPTFAMRRAHELLTRFHLLDRQHDFVEHLSGGLQRRGEIAKGLMHQPTVLLMDEPSTGLDPGARHDLWSMINNLRKDGMTILLTTHLMEEADRCDRLAILHKGHCVTLGTPVELKSKIGGDVISILSKEAAPLTEKIRARFNVNPQTIDQTVRLEQPDGHKFIPALVEAFPGMIDAITVGKPTLEDVFLHETGEKL